MSKKQLLFYAFLNLLIGVFFFSKIRIFLYRYLLGYRISWRTKLGMFPILIGRKITIQKNVTLGSFVQIIDCKTCFIHENAKIFRFAKIGGLELFSLGKNSIIGVKTTIFSRFRDRAVNGIINGGRFVCGNDCVITKQHTFDVLGNILIKGNVVIGGQDTSMYTHSYDCFRNISYGDIVIRKNVYIGAKSTILAGCTVGDNVVIAANSLVCKSIKASGVYGGVPVRLLSDNPRRKNFLIRK